MEIGRGKLIVFEGGEGSGKSTQLQAIEEWLKQSPLLDEFAGVLTTREPGGTGLGVKIREALLTPDFSVGLIAPTAELLLYAADRAQHVEYWLEPALEAGFIVLCDRYTDSTIAYQGDGRGLGLGLICQLNEIATGGLKSDLTIWLDVEPELGLARAKAAAGQLDRIEQADLDFHQRVRSGFAALAEANGDRMVRIDAGDAVEVVTEAIKVRLRWELGSGVVRARGEA
jgi:dTMP kinase